MIHLLAAATIAGVLSSPVAFPGEQAYGKQAAISIQRARAIALHAFPGAIVAQELEKEKGGSGLRYSFDIRRGAVTREVGVDARTGAVLENAAETGDD